MHEQTHTITLTMMLQGRGLALTVTLIGAKWASSLRFFLVKVSGFDQCSLLTSVMPTENVLLGFAESLHHAKSSNQALY